VVHNDDTKSMILELAKAQQEAAAEDGDSRTGIFTTAHNTSGEFDTLLANCLVHARRKYVDIVQDFPQECRYVLEWDTPVLSSLASQGTSAFPVIMAGRLPHWLFRGLLGVHCALQPARFAGLPREAFLLECFSPVISS
jgi:hypothetical protein